jgi:hypothetical protein
MHAIRHTVQTSLDALLRDADAVLPVDDTDADANTTEVAPNDGVRRPPPTTDKPPLPAPVAWTESKITSFVVVSAVFHAAQIIATELKRILRATVLACVSAGAEVRGGYHLEITRTVRRPQQRRECDHHYREAVLHLLRLDGLTTAQVDAIVAAHGRWSHTLKWVCNSEPGPRYAWPGPLRTAGGSDAAIQRLRDVGDRIVCLATATPVIKTAFGQEHPLIGSTDTTDIMGLLWERFAGIETETRTVLAGLEADIRRRAGEPSISVLNRAAAEAQRRNATRAVPEPLLAGYIAVATDLQFLARVEAMHRAHLITILKERTPPPRHQWESGPLPKGCHLPEIACRLTSRKIINWKRLYALQWPKSFATEEREWQKAAEASIGGKDGTVVYASRIEFIGN